MSSPPSNPGDQPLPRSKRSRGERSWHQATEALYLLNRRRRLLYANPAWEHQTGLTFAEVRGRACRHRASMAGLDSVEQLLAALAPPPEALQGRPCQTRRRAPGKRLSWSEIDFFPWSNADGVLAILGKLRVTPETGPAHAALPEKLVQLRARHNQTFRLESWHSDAPAGRRLIEQLRLAAQTRAPALIQGPPGSGKEWAARTIHHVGQRQGGERERFFACLDARLPAAAFAEALSSGRHWQVGTLYLKNVEKLPRDVQEQLLQSCTADADEPGPRLLAGSSANLEEEVRAGRLLPDLLAHLSVLTVQVPPLAQRMVDLPQLLTQLLTRAGRAADHVVEQASPAVLELLQRHAWPGNLAELYETLVQACRHVKGTQLDVEDLPFYLRNMSPQPQKPLALDETLAKVERRMIELALRLAQDNKTRAAELLAIWRPRLTRRLEHFGMETKEVDPPTE